VAQTARGTAPNRGFDSPRAWCGFVDISKDGYDSQTDGTDLQALDLLRFDDDFKAQATPLVVDEAESVAGVPRDLDLTEKAPRECVKRARVDRTWPDVVTTADRSAHRPGHSTLSNSVVLLESANIPSRLLGRAVR